MSGTSPSIKSLLLAPAPQTTQLAVSVGLQLDNNAIVWQQCQFFSESQETFATIQHLVDESVAPVLIGRQLDELAALFDTLLSLERTLTLSYTVVPEKTGAVSRREIFSGTFSEKEPEPETVYYDIQKPLPIALTSGVMSLLLECAARFVGETAVSHLATLTNTPLTKLSPRPLHLTLPYAEQHSIFTPSLLSMGYAAPTEDDELLLGKNGQIYQGHIRRLKAHLRRSEPKGKYMYLPLAGAYGRLYENNVGRILGACSGVERSVKPCTVWLEDPIILEDTDEQEKLTLDLKSYMRTRQMKTKLVAYEGVGSETAVQAIIDKELAHTIRLDLAQFRSFTEFVSAIKLCKERQFEFVLGGAGTSPELLAWLGILFGARLVYTGDVEQTAAVSAEMFRTAMGLNKLAGNI